jgi:prepilin-type N-terminal cleavage/methylation domain-containing protein
MIRTLQSFCGRGRNRGFTLVELLVVIAIMAILFGLVIGLAAPAANKRKVSRVQAELKQLELAIESYKDKLGFYPPDNSNLTLSEAERTARPPLFYELTGTVLNPSGRFVSLTGGDTASGLAPADVTLSFGNAGFANASTEPENVRNFARALRSSQHAEIRPNVELLVVPVDAPKDDLTVFDDAKEPGKKRNPWRYNSSNPTRNPNSYDLWAEIDLRGRTVLIGNWKD